MVTNKWTSILALALLGVIGCPGDDSEKNQLAKDLVRLKEEHTKKLSEEKARFDEFQKQSAERVALLTQELETKNQDLVHENERLKNPLESFKLESKRFIERLAPGALFGQANEAKFTELKQKLQEFSDPAQILLPPLQKEDVFPLSLQLVFEHSPRPASELTLYIPIVHGTEEHEKNAMFILATDDKNALEKLLANNNIESYNYYVFKAPTGYPVLSLGNGVYLLAKSLTDPLYERKPSKFSIPLNYRFRKSCKLPDNYAKYERNIKIRDSERDAKVYSAFENQENNPLKDPILVDLRD